MADPLDYPSEREEAEELYRVLGAANGQRYIDTAECAKLDHNHEPHAHFVDISEQGVCDGCALHSNDLQQPNIVVGDWLCPDCRAI